MGRFGWASPACGGTACGWGIGAGASPGRVGTGCGVVGGGAGMPAPTGPLVEPLVNGASVPVEAAGNGGSSSLTDAAPPCAGPIDAVRMLTD